MHLLPNGWHIPRSPARCANLGHPVACNFARYSNATNLAEDEKLAPNSDITGSLIQIPSIHNTNVSLTPHPDLPILYHYGHTVIDPIMGALPR